MAATVFSVLESKMDEYVLSAGDALVAGKCADYSEYKYLCGQIRGLKVAQATIIDLKRQMEQDDNDG